MSLLPQSVPTPLYERALALDLVPRRIADLASYAQTLYGYEGPMLYRHSAALLTGADLTPDQRDQIEQSVLAYIRYASSHPELGVTTYARYVPHLSPHAQAVAREEAQAVLARYERYILGRSWEAPWGTLLRFRDTWRVLAPDSYDEWLQRELDKLLHVRAWSDTPEPYREHAAHIHLLDELARQEAMALALRCIPAVGDSEVTEDREWAFAGGRIYSDEDVDVASRAAQTEALFAIAPILVPSLHDRAHALAHERGYDLHDLLGSALRDPLRMNGVDWYHLLPDIPVPWLSPVERQHSFAVVDAPIRDALIEQFVVAYEHLAQEFQTNPSRRAVVGDPVAARFRWLVDHDLPVAAPSFDANQTRRLLALYGLP